MHSPTYAERIEELERKVAALENANPAAKTAKKKGEK